MSEGSIANTLSGRAGLNRWFATPRGEIALQARVALLRSFVWGWPRRSRSVLVMAPGNLVFPEVLYEAGFDVTVQEDDRFLFNNICAGKKSCISAVLSVPDHLPFNDNAFDYTVVVAGLEFWEQPEAVLRELNRVTCSGCLLLFAHTLSCYGVEQLWNSRFRRNHMVPGRTWRNDEVQKLVNRAFPRHTTATGSVLLLPSPFWEKKIARRWATHVVPFPLGAVAGVRIDFGKIKTGTPLMLPACEAGATY